MIGRHRSEYRELLNEPSFYTRYGKRLLDLGLVIITAPLFLTLIAAVAVSVWIRLGRPLLFQQVRVGQDGNEFLLHKFRTMTSQRGLDGNLLPDHLRLTPFGKWLRSTSLDELPGLWNVVRGEMSLVGPRPLLVQYLPLYSKEQARRHEVCPGITGLAQINGRNAISWEEKFCQDVIYVDTCSLQLDIKILALTLIKIIQRDGIEAAGCATMPTFAGSESSSNQTEQPVA